MPAGEHRDQTTIREPKLPSIDPADVIRNLTGTATRGTVRLLAALPAPVQRFLTTGRKTHVDGLDLEPEVGLSLRLLDFFGDSFESHPPEEARRIVREEALTFAGRPVPGVVVEEVEIPGPGGKILARLYKPADLSVPSPLVVYYHGGGWVVCDLDTHDAFCRFLARETRFDVLSVAYRLAPENPFPAALDDAVAAFRWAVDEAEAMGVDPARIAVAGDSAGGNLAATVAQQTTAAGGPSPAYQVLIYPVTDLSTKTRSYELFATGYFLTEAQMDWYRAHYIGDADGTDPRCSPLLADDLTGLPPAYVTTAGFDVLRDEGEAYAARLEAAGVPTTLRRHEGLVHGWINAVSIGRSPRRAGDELVEAIRDALGRPAPAESAS